MKRVLLALAVLAVMAPSAWAQEAIYAKANSPEYKQKFWGMIGRGILNVATCPVDLIVNVVNETKAGPPLIGTLTGVGKGVGCTALRALSGGVDILTFWVPNFNGMPVSYSYDDCLATEGREAMLGSGSSSSIGGGAYGSATPAKKPYTK
ncbi:MAG: hypothetical protein HY597_02210 [Candidatus Omnitrophica bacterium]|nr:hypothetical protein [Candidatus Omnitrophota bacterium]